MTPSDQAQRARGQVARKLFPRAAANHLAKLPEFQQLSHKAIARMRVQTPDEGADVLTRAGRAEAGAATRAELRLLVAMLHDREWLLAQQESDTWLAGRLAGYARTDVNQIRDAISTKDLDYYLSNGVDLVFPSLEKRRCVVEDQPMVQDVPLVERLKAARIFTVNGFAGSRVMHFMHDIIDHVWLFSRLRRHGLFARYGDFLASIDMGPQAFLYSRQAELISTIGFGSRRWPLATKAEDPPIITDHHLEALLADSGDLRVDDALAAYRRTSTQGREWIRYVIENMAIQIADERRRWGSVKQRQADGSRRPMAMLEPIYLAFLVEGIIHLQDRLQDFLDIQVKVAAFTDLLLHAGLASPHTSTARQVTLQEVIDPENLHRLAPSDAAWIISRPYFATAYTKLNDL